MKAKTEANIDFAEVFFHTFCEYILTSILDLFLEARNLKNSNFTSTGARFLQNRGFRKIIKKKLNFDSVFEGQNDENIWQNGNEKYTTEVILGNYNGTLTMLDSRGSGSSESISDMSSDMNQEAIDSSSADIDIDDEIPF